MVTPHALINATFLYVKSISELIHRKKIKLILLCMAKNIGSFFVGSWKDINTNLARLTCNKVSFPIEH